MKNKIFQPSLDRNLKNFKDNIAIEYGSRAITYAELDKGANCIAHWMIKRGCETGAMVGVWADDHLVFIAAMTAVFKARTVFVPLDTANPDDRLEKIIDITNLKLILTDAAVYRRYSSRPLIKERNIRLVIVEDLLKAEKELDFIDSPALPYSPEDKIYIYFTSGTTGQPKGVVGKNKSLTHYCQWEVDAFNIPENFRISQFSNTGFDAFLKEVFVTFFSGGTLCIPTNKQAILEPAKLIDWMEKNRINLFHGVPSVFRLLNSRELTGGNLRDLKYVLLSGEKIYPEELRNWYDKFNERIQIVNLYGTTETTILSSYYPVQKADINKKRIPIGKPIKGTRMIILDENIGICSKGEVGEIYIRTPYLTFGYYNSPGQNKKRFLQNPFNRSPGDIIFKTGDLGRLLLDGNIEILGRRDRQVKIRGVRVELEEIEITLLKHPMVKEAAVVKRESANHNDLLCAYIVKSGKNQEDNDLLISKLGSYLKEKLPDYITATKITVIKKMPQKANGKIDYDALPDPFVELKAAYIAPRNDVEKKLSELWSQILEVDEIGIKTRFFQLGGNSLNNVSLVSKINRTFNIQLSIPEIFSHATIELQARLVREKIKNQGEELHPLPVKKTEKKEYYALSSAQQRLYILHQIADDLAYNMPMAMRLKGSLDIPRLEQAIKQLIQRHESLRTSFRIVAEEPVQMVLPPDGVQFEITYYDYPGAPSTETGIIRNFRRSFDLSHSPLLRVGLIKTGASEHLLLVDMHHIITDGVSQAILIKDLAALYQREELPRLITRYKDYAEWEKSKERLQSKQRQESFWLKIFTRELPVLDLPYDYPRPQVQNFAGGKLDFQFTEKETTAIKAIGEEENVTLYMTILSFFNILLSKLSGQEDIIIGTPIAGRRYPEFEHIVGMFVNTLALRNYPSADKTVKDFLGEVRKLTLEAFENQEYPFEELVDKISLPRDLSRNPLFDVMFMLKNFNMPSIQTPGLKITAYDYEKNISKFDLTLSCLEANNRLHLSFEYCTKLFKKESIRAFILYFKKIVYAVISGDNPGIGDIEIISDQEKQGILYEFNNTISVYPADKSISQLFQAQVEKKPGNIAIEMRYPGTADKPQTYRELNNTINRLAHTLRSKGVKPGSIVGLAVDRSPHLVTGIMAILKAGGAYLPIQLEYPVSRINYLIKDSGTSMILTDRDILPDIDFKGTGIDLKNPRYYGEDSTNPDSINNPDNLAYVIYTSGTTGNPKGVMISHKAVSNYICWAARTYVKNEKTRFPLYTSISFDLTVTSLYTPLLTGNSLIIYGKEEKELLIEQLIKDNKSEVVKLTPAHLKIIRDLGIKANIKWFIVGGEELESALARDIYRQFQGEVEIYNEYGPTEATVGCMIFRYSPEKDENKSVPIGKPIDNVRVYILDKNQKPVPRGVSGEIYISGEGLARGYLNKPELTAEKFGLHRTGGRFLKKLPPLTPRKNFLLKEGGKDEGQPASRETMQVSTYHSPVYPITPLLHSPIYRTGDLAKWLPGGNIDFLGRLDNQVKIRGYRIELGEIESRLLKKEGIRDILITIKKDREGEKYLCAYFVSNQALGAAELRGYLSQELPGYMIPSHFIQLDKFPLTDNGKIDRKALPDPEIKSTRRYTAPGNDAEEKLVELWSEVLGIEKDIIGIDENFFDLGGNSLKIIRLNNRMKTVFQKDIPLVTLFRYPTIGSIAANLNDSTAEIRSREETLDSGKMRRIQRIRKREEMRIV